MHFLLLSTVLVHTAVPSFITDHKCPGSSGMSCEDDQECCPYGGGGGGYMCCEQTTADTCCGGGCCEDAQTCCSDDKGASCCMQQSTFCVQKTSSSGLPSRCCPRWTVGCSTGSVGCCDPAQPWQWNIAATASTANTRITSASASVRITSHGRSRNDTHEHFGASASVVRAGGPTVAYALIVSGWASGKSSLIALTIDTASGKIAKKIAVRTFLDDPAGDETREFVWDSGKKL